MNLIRNIPETKYVKPGNADCPGGVLSSTVATSHMWPFKFELIKAKVKFKSQFLSHTSHISGAQ